MSTNMNKAQRLRKARMILIDINRKMDQMGKRLEAHQRRENKRAA